MRIPELENVGAVLGVHCIVRIGIGRLVNPHVIDIESGVNAQ